MLTIFPWFPRPGTKQLSMHSQISQTVPKIPCDNQSYACKLTDLIHLLMSASNYYYIVSFKEREKLNSETTKKHSVFPG